MSLQKRKKLNIPHEVCDAFEVDLSNHLVTKYPELRPTDCDTIAETAMRFVLTHLGAKRGRDY